MPLTQVQGGMILPSTTLTTPIVATTMGVGGATPSTSGAGITFPATQSASTNANTLDDYEEGTWTPVNASIASLTISVVSATYVKVGKMVYVNFYVNYPSTADTNDAKIGGLPFTVGAGSINYFTGRTGYTGKGQITSQTNENTTEFFFYGGNTATTITNANLSGQYLLLSGVYQSAS
jgi:hypothetical protein